MGRNGELSTKLGQIYIDSEVIATYAGSVAVECFGIVGMAAVNVKDGIVKLLKKDYLPVSIFPMIIRLSLIFTSLFLMALVLMLLLKIW